MNGKNYRFFILSGWSLLFLLLLVSQTILADVRTPKTSVTKVKSRVGTTVNKLQEDKLRPNRGQYNPIKFINPADTFTHTLYLPFVYNNFCKSFFYNELLPFNLIKIHADVWSCYTGKGVVVAVLDSGVDLDHPDLQANIIPGKNFVSDISAPEDDFGHGTHVAGIIAGTPNNGGIIGVAPEVSIMPVKVISSNGSGTTYALIQGIIWSADNGADIINMSLLDTTYNLLVWSAVFYAHNIKGVLLVASAGNCGGENHQNNGCSYQDQVMYPAAFSEVIAVASTSPSDDQSWFSNEGDYVELSAPGEAIYSTFRDGQYEILSGTSMAAPHVSGLAALIWSKNPNLTNEQVRALMNKTAADLGASGRDNKFGYGRIDVAAALYSPASATELTLAPTPPTFDLPQQPEKIPQIDETPFVPGEILVKPAPGFSVNDILQNPAVKNNNQIQVLDTIPQIGIQKLSVPVGQEKSTRTKLLSLNSVEFVELNYILTVH